MKKCIVLDLDGTLWGGIIGEDGIDGIALSLSGDGAAFIAFQQALLDLHHRGIILAINSRNNPEDALLAIRNHPNMILKEEHFAAMRINWASKVDNLRELAHELNISLEAMVFIDDDPMNRMAVRSQLPEVEVPELPADPFEYVRLLMALPYFPANATTDEDKMRGNLYVTERLRKESEKAFTSHDDFLKDLRLQVTVSVNDLSCVARLAQLSEKTNQFNTNKHPMSEEEIFALMQDPQRTVFHARAADKFGDHGVILLAVVDHRGQLWCISHFLMSCRVIARGIEDACLAAIAQVAQMHHVKTLSATFVATEKNKPAEDFIKKYFTDTTVAVERVLQAPSWVHLTVVQGNL